MYADDTVLLVDGVNWNATQAHADAALAVVTHWLSRNLLRLNADKTLCFTFSPNSASHPPPSFTVVAHVPSCTRSITHTEEIHLPLFVNRLRIANELREITLWQVFK